ncbi:archaellum component FlaG (FlaF/FlaG flagellin family) [Parabacteroides sp. PFB2-12]|uniref:DUF1573 domain-containing protein n=1 Tax=unclassified Parabacteroides TaxID=2649774 RepID=UPI002474F7F5|nr:MULTISPECIES: DUF1573 domain-containing protein [unclassified Parabacteroides]MDH6344022.1 archaellum component FlaG (FlaF/FlaG flagellin family) [Parabacteroides sp. PM6-13]MDH6391882.1 archaellum component FlaG (FlaF/FlaG flagellin family) [Parabacteroides sp. PFB2-12]
MTCHLKRIMLIVLGIVCFTIAGAQSNAQLKVEETTFNFGNINEVDGPVNHVFTIRNTGKKPLVITRVTASCGCTRPEWSKEPIAAGKTGELKITFDPKGRPGPFLKTISIYSNGNKGSYILTIKGNVKPKSFQPVFTYPYSIGELKLHTKTILYSTIRPEETIVERINLLNDTQQPLTVVLGKVANCFATSVSPEVLKPGETGEITVQLDAKAVKRMGRITAELPVAVVSIDQKETVGSIQIAANIIDNFNKLTAAEKAQAPVAHLSGTLLEFGQLPTKGSIIPLIGGRATISFDITNTGKTPLQIYSVTSDDERLDISGGRRELKPGATATFKVSVRPKEVKTKLESLINVVCNDPNGPVRLIKVTAYK